MGLILPPNFLQSLKYKHLLLDTNVFIDGLLHPNDFSDFFGTLKANEVTLVTIDLVKIEFLRGSQDADTYKKKDEVFSSVIDSILPTDQNIVNNVYQLIKQYKISGKTVAIADLFLGANLMKYSSRLYLLTRDTTDFPANIFSLDFIINYPLPKGIFTYGVYKII